MSDDVGAINRVLRLVSLLSDHPHLTAKQAAAILGWPVSSTHRLLRKLAEAEFAAQTERGTFTAGMELFRIVGRLAAKVPFVEIAEPLLGSLSQQFGETSLLSILERRQLRMYTAFAASPQDPMRYIIELNRRDPLVWGASGRALLAHLGPEEIEAVIAMGAAPNARGDTLDAAELRGALAAVLSRGFAMSRSHRTLNSVGIAVPFFGSAGDVVGSVAFQVPAFRFQEGQVETMVTALQHTATVISQQIGARGQY
jgi:DNA-binding IclR family transcriptional regulator